jgi:hypothetical protein
MCLCSLIVCTGQAMPQQCLAQQSCCSSCLCSLIIVSRSTPAVSLIARLLTSTSPCLQSCCTALDPWRTVLYIFGYACTYWKKEAWTTCLPATIMCHSAILLEIIMLACEVAGSYFLFANFMQSGLSKQHRCSRQSDAACCVEAMSCVTLRMLSGLNAKLQVFRKLFHSS